MGCGGSTPAADPQQQDGAGKAKLKPQESKAAHVVPVQETTPQRPAAPRVAQAKPHAMGSPDPPRREPKTEAAASSVPHSSNTINPSIALLSELANETGEQWQGVQLLHQLQMEKIAA
uniref:Uncharacterized protein n=1 Tax=Eutreptiella gymnastica TaxID=73025 RepID=A0A7S1NUN8_9EUGL|mmetsp:Transcript_90774/g.157427  ORF Transcript_90774/g.157427 Transcript_90774/m.157427 type:complete len:118 (+) Transcript_90774:59-412(+)